MVIHANAVIKNLIVHKINESGPEISEHSIKLGNETLEEILIKYFFKPFRDAPKYALHHDSSLDMNEVFAYASEIFDDPDQFYINTVKLTKHLYNKSSHHSIKNGDVFIAYFEDCVLEDEIVDAIGIFKAENKDTFLKVYPQNEQSFGIDSADGINVNKLDKGAIIFNTDKEEGYTVMVTDSVNKDNARYWIDEFLNAKPVNDDFHQTQGMINLCQEFIQETIPETEHTDRISMMNDSISYLKSSDTYDNEEFKDQVLQKPELIDAFESFREQAIADDKITPDEKFEVSNKAIKKTKRFIRSVIKLDKNFHVYVHGNREHISKGFDDQKNKHFYTLYFDEEN